MSIKFFLDNLTPQAIKYISTIVKSNSQESYRKLKKIFLDQSIELKGFEDTTLDIINFDWNGIERDRNWWWQAQALPFLNWYIDSYNLQNEEERKKYFSLCIVAIDNWNTKTESCESPLAWHDHGTAFRTRNIVNWVTFCYIRDAEIIALSDNINLSKLIIEHLEWLLDNENYSKYTNHGFDQAMILLTISIMFNTDELEPQRLVSRQRLEEEIKFAFTDEGVHKENSPGYQKFMLGRLKQLRTLKPLGEQIISNLAESYIEKAEEFLRVITLPNGYLPMIGDTKGEDRGLKYSQKNTVDILNYSASGYVIIRGKTITDKNFHLLFKCSYLSNYHRHDDDLSLHLFFDNVVVLGDGGLGSHNEMNEKRKILRSKIAHNVPYIVGMNPIRSETMLEKSKEPCVHILGNKITAESYSYGIPIRREIDFTELLIGNLCIKDKILEDSEMVLATHFYSPSKISKEKESLIIENSEKVIAKIDPLTKGLFHYIPSIYSSVYNIFEEKESYSFYSETKSSEIKIGLESQPEVIFKINYRNFGPIEIKSANGWFYDKNFPNNVCHHIMSLRWLTSIESDKKIKDIFVSFFHYHNNEKNEKSKYYLGPDAEHTTSIRLEVLVKLYKKFKYDDHIHTLIKNEISENIISCLNDTYKEKNNHGLMVDKAILLCIFEEEDIYNIFEKEIPFIFERLLEQIDAIFDDEGYCKEHSISYQEYNLGIMLNLLKVIKKVERLEFKNILNSIENRIKLIRYSSKITLGYSLKDNDEYITIGDSFEKPKPQILNEAFGNVIAKQALLPYSEQLGFFFNKTLGIAIFRSKEIHLSLNASWHSYVHKQNDDLSIFLRVNREDIFVDGGYSDIISKNRVDTSSQYLHSTIIPQNKSWKLKGSINSGYSELHSPVEIVSNEVVVFSGSHSRIIDTITSRKIEIDNKNNIIKIMDKVSNNGLCIHRFLIPNEHDITIEEKLVIIKTKENTITIKCYSTDEFIEENTVSCSKTLIEGVKNNEVRKLTALDFSSQGSGFFLVSL